MRRPSPACLVALLLMVLGALTPAWGEASSSRGHIVMAWGPGGAANVVAGRVPAALNRPQASIRLFAGAAGNRAFAEVNGREWLMWGDNLAQHRSELLRRGARIEDVAVGATHACLTAQGYVECVGGRMQPELLPLPQGMPRISDISAGDGYTCAVAQQRVWCWGSGQHPGQRLTEAVGSRAMAAVSAGPSMACGLTLQGTAICALNVAARQQTALPVPRGVVFRALTVGGRHACGLRNNGLVLCWGANEWGQALAPPTFPSPAIKIAAGSDHTCALLANGAIQCWGRRDDGSIAVPVLPGRAVDLAVTAGASLAVVELP